MSVKKWIQASLCVSIIGITLQDLRLSQHLICIISALGQSWMVPTILYLGYENSIIEIHLREIQRVCDDFDCAICVTTTLMTSTGCT